MSGQKQLPVKLNSVVNASRYVPSTSQSSLIVAVRVRPLLRKESALGGKKDIMRVIDGRVVVVLDPDATKEYLDVVQNRTKEKRYTFDVAFPPESTNEDVYNGTIRDLVVGVLYGINTTVFAYGATGSGKTYTMVGGQTDPGLMILSLQRIFMEKDRLFKDEDFEVTCSYSEVYNEVIYDLLVKNSGPLELREDPELGVQVAGLKNINVRSADDILELLDEGNKRRKTESTDANAQSSRSHAVLEITIKRMPRNHYRVQQLRAKLSLVDLAGSERAADTNNAGQKLRDGANINRSLLALANCINALGKLSGSSSKAASYVPYRNSKLTRLLKDGLSGNSRTAMIATVSASSDQYHHSIGTLKYADRAKEIKTHVVQNVGTVESHISDYQRIIDNLQGEVQDLKAQLSERVVPPQSLGLPSSTESEVLGLIDSLVQEMNDNIEERINLQKALFEIEDANICNKYELQQLDEFLDAGQGSVKDVTEARDRRADVLMVIKDNERERDKYKAEIAENEQDRRGIQSKVDQLTNTNQNVAFLNLMSTFRLQAVRLQEVKFQMAVRDQVIGEQREVIANLWRILDKSGLGRTRVLEIAKQEGIIMDGFLPLSEEQTRGPTPPANGARHKSGFNVGRPDKVANSKHHHHHHHDSVSTPNASLAGNRAKMRYRFWAEYAGSDDESSDHFGLLSRPSEPPQVISAAASAAARDAAREAARDKPPLPRRRVSRPGGGQLNGPPRADSPRGGGKGAAGRRPPPGKAAAPWANKAPPADDKRKFKVEEPPPAEKKAAGAPRPGAYREMVNKGSNSDKNNATVPPAPVRAGRRAGQPGVNGAPTDGLQEQLPNRVGEAWPAPSSQQPALNDRLAKLKMRMGRRTDDTGNGGLHAAAADDREDSLDAFRSASRGASRG